MSNPQNKKQDARAARRAAEKRMLPFAVEFVKFIAGFVVILACALLALHFASAAMR